MLPWMLQTASYTRAVVADAGVAADEFDDTVTTRCAATELLGRIEIEVLMHEEALRTPVLDAVGMSDQSHHLLRISVRPSVSLRVVRAGTGVHGFRHGGFSVIEFAEHEPVLYREDDVHGVLLDHDPAIPVYQSLARRLRSSALGEQDTRSLISRIAMNAYGENRRPP